MRMAVCKMMTLFNVLPTICSLLALPTPAQASSDSAADIHDILPKYNLPKGIFPNVPHSYTLSQQDGAFTVKLADACYVRFDDQLVYYAPVIKGRLSYGQITHVSGIQARMFLIWLSVTGMAMDTHSDLDMVEFRVGALTHKLPAHRFQAPPSCINNNNNNNPSSSI